MHISDLEEVNKLNRELKTFSKICDGLADNPDYGLRVSVIAQSGSDRHLNTDNYIKTGPLLLDIKTVMEQHVMRLKNSLKELGVVFPDDTKDSVTP